MSHEKMLKQLATGQGFLAALDQSGGSTPEALAQYGIPHTAYTGDEDMFRLMHEMRVRIMTARAFTGAKVIATILFERTMNGQAMGKNVPAYLWEDRGIVPLLKVDKGLESEQDGVRLMKPMPGLDDLLVTAKGLGVAGTKMRSTINLANEAGIIANVAQQFEFAAQIAGHGLLPIVETEVLIASPEKAAAETMLLAALSRALDASSVDCALKLTLPETPNLYEPLLSHPRVTRIVALSGGYSRQVACARLAHNRGVIASFSRALVDDLRASQTEAAFEDDLGKAIDEIYEASVVKG